MEKTRPAIYALHNKSCPLSLPSTSCALRLSPAPRAQHLRLGPNILQFAPCPWTQHPALKPFTPSPAPAPCTLRPGPSVLRPIQRNEFAITFDGCANGKIDDLYLFFFTLSIFDYFFFLFRRFSSVSFFPFLSSLFPPFLVSILHNFFPPFSFFFYSFLFFLHSFRSVLPFFPFHLLSFSP